MTKPSSEEMTYSNEIHYVGNLVIEGSETFVIKDTKFIIEGNIIVKDNASLVIKRSYILINNTFEQQYWVIVQDFATLWIEDSELTVSFRTGGGAVITVNHNSKLFMNNTRCNWSVGASDNSETKISNSYVERLCWNVISKVNITNSIIFNVFEIAFDAPIKLNVDFRNLKPGRVDEIYLQVVGFIYLKNVTINLPQIKLGAVYELQTKVNLTISDSQLAQLWLLFPSYTKLKIRNLRSGFFAKWNLYDYVSGEGLEYNVTLVNTYVKQYKLSFWGGEAKVINATGWGVLDTYGDTKVYVENSTLIQGYHSRGSKYTKFSNVIIREHIAFWTYSGRRPGFGENRIYSVIEFTNTTVGYFSLNTFIEVTPYHTAIMKGNVSINVPMERFLWSPGGVIIREYPVMVFDEKEKPLANTSLSLLGPDGTPVWIGVTDNMGRCFFNITFTYENYTQALTLRLDSFNITKEIGLLSTTPIIFSPWSKVRNLLSRAESIILWTRSIGKSEDLIKNATALLAEAKALYEDGKLTSSMELARKIIELLSFKIDGNPKDWEGIRPLQRDPEGDAEFSYADLKAVYAVEDDEYLYITVETYSDIENQRIFFISMDTNLDGFEDFVVLSPPDKNRYILAKPYKDVYEIQYGIDEVAEFRVPLMVLGYPSSVTIEVVARNTTTGEQYDAIKRTSITRKSNISLNVSPANVKKGEPIVVFGTLYPLHVNAVVKLIYESPNGTILARNVTTTALGNFKDTLIPTTVGNWSIIAYWPGDLDHEGIYSDILYFFVNKPYVVRFSATDLENTPISGVTIFFNNTEYSHGQSVEARADTYSLSAGMIPVGYEFDHWGLSGNVTVTDSYAASTTVTINGDANITMVLRCVPSSPPTFELKNPYVIIAFIAAIALFVFVLIRRK